MGMKPTSVVLPADLRVRLAKVAGQHGFLNTSELIRMALREKCEQLEAKEAGA